MSAKLDERLKRAIGRTRAVWYVVNLVALWFMVFHLKAWALLLIVPFAFLSYAILLYITIHILAATTPPEEIAEAEAENAAAAEDAKKLEAVAAIAARQAAGEDVPNEEVIEALNASGIIEVVTVSDTGPVVGSFNGKDIYEYILVKMPKHDGVDKMVYHGPAKIVNGMAEIPVIDGMVFACVENILYAKEVQPK